MLKQVADISAWRRAHRRRHHSAHWGAHMSSPSAEDPHTRDLPQGPFPEGPPECGHGEYAMECAECIAHHSAYMGALGALGDRIDALLGTLGKRGIRPPPEVWSMVRMEALIDALMPMEARPYARMVYERECGERFEAQLTEGVEALGSGIILPGAPRMHGTG